MSLNLPLLVEDASSDSYLQNILKELQKIAEHDMSDCGDVVHLTERLNAVLSTMLSLARQGLPVDTETMVVGNAYTQAAIRVRQGLQDMKDFADKGLSVTPIAFSASPPAPPKKQKSKKAKEQPTGETIDQQSNP